MNGFQQRRIGRTDLQVSVLGLGGAPLGDLYERIPADRALATLETAYRRGIRLFDTAPLYGHGLSEHRFGHVLRDKPRAEFVISTKVGRWLRPDRSEQVDRGQFVGGLNFQTVYDYSYDGTMRALEQSYQRLGMDRIDIALIHDIDVFTHGPEAQPTRFHEAMDGAYRALARLKADGTIGAIGLGVNDWRVCLDALRHSDFDGFLLAGRYTLIDQSALSELLPACERRGARVILGGPYNSGILARGAIAGATFDYRPAEPAILERVRAMTAVCAAFNVPLQAAALQFPLGHPAIVTILPGARNPAEVEANLHFAAHPIPGDFWRALRDSGLIAPEAPLPGGKP